MEDQFEDLNLNIREIYSCLKILQQALGNDTVNTEVTEIDDYLEIIIEKLSNTMNKFNEFGIQYICK